MSIDWSSLPGGFAPKLQEALSGSETATAAWQQVIGIVSGTRLSPSIWQTLWNLAQEKPSGPTAVPMWFPDSDALQNSCLAGWMAVRGDRSFEDFRQWSLTKRAEFWSAAAKRLEIRFRSAASSILKHEPGSTKADWFPGAKLNIAESCFLAEPSNPAIVSAKPGHPLRTISYGELKSQAAKIAGSIVRAGYQPDDALGVVLPMTAESVALYLGIIWAGCRAVSIADSFAPPEIANRLRIAGARAVFTYDVQVRGGKTLPLYQRVCDSTELPVIVLPEDESTLQVTLRANDRSWNEFRPEGQAIEPHIASSDAVINVLFSSGTTGDPKAIPWTQLTPLKCAVDGLVHQDIRPGHVVCWPTSLGWMMGPWLIFAALINRGTIALFEGVPVTEDFGRFVQDARVNMLGVVPTIVRAWRESKIMEQFDWSGIHVFSSTGESSRSDDMVYLGSLAGMRPVIEYCGGTEIGGGYISSTVLQPNVPAAFSTPGAGLDFVILDEAGNPADEGQLFLIPPAIGLSSSLLNRDHDETYFADNPKCPDHGTASGTKPSPGTLLRRHGDHFRRIPSGYFAAGGRVDDTMNLGGIKTSSAEIERVLNLVPGVHETAAVAWSDGGGPEELHVFVVCHETPQADTLLPAMNQRLKTDLNPLFKVRAIHPVDKLPRTASNKVMRRLLRDQLMKQP